jgi:hypothetical protein
MSMSPEASDGHPRNSESPQPESRALQGLFVASRHVREPMLQVDHQALLSDGEADPASAIADANCFARAVEVEFRAATDPVLDPEATTAEHGPVCPDPCAEREEVVRDLPDVHRGAGGCYRPLVVAGRFNAVVVRMR